MHDKKILTEISWIIENKSNPIFSVLESRGLHSKGKSMPHLGLSQNFEVGFDLRQLWNRPMEGPQVERSEGPPKKGFEKVSSSYLHCYELLLRKYHNNNSLCYCYCWENCKCLCNSCCVPELNALHSAIFKGYWGIGFRYENQKGSKWLRWGILLSLPYIIFLINV